LHEVSFGRRVRFRSQRGGFLILRLHRSGLDEGGQFALGKEGGFPRLVNFNSAGSGVISDRITRNVANQFRFAYSAQVERFCPLRLLYCEFT
jgi:hypothetical protein